ncbi:DNA translocase FtsK 4TM domain-containing protein [Candidatus Kaiserbacteria bacterium]|nr:DNA translocase FtsK 4TM domain-containing protein [Candidatus Kaiserbacteria bacterium]
MARKNKKSQRFTNIFADLKEETVHGIWGVIFLFITLFFILAAFDSAGVAGKSAYGGLSFLFGVGYFLLPVVCLFIAVSFFRAHEHAYRPLKIIGAGVLVLSTLSLIDIAVPLRGGFLGGLIATPLLALFDTYASVLVLSALFVLSLLIMFDVLPKLPSLSFLTGIFSQRRDTQEEYDVETYIDEDAAETEEEAEEEENEEEETEEELKESSGIFGFGKKEERAGMYPAFGAYTPPPLSLLEKDKGKPDVGDIKANANIIKRTLQNFGIHVEMDEITVGPTVTRYALKPAEGVRLSKILALQNNLELALAAHPVRIEAPIPGKSLVGIEVPNASKSMVGLAPLLSSEEFARSERPLVIALGRDIAGASHFADLSKMPHLLIAGTTGSGKSVMIHNIIMSLLYRKSPQDMRLIMVDPKRVELTLYKNIPHLLTPVITDAKRAILALKWLATEMDRRYDILEAESVRDVASYHKNILAPALKNKVPEEDMPEPMPYIILIMDELADIMQTYPRELEAAIVRLAQMSRAVGIHLILSTQRPSVQVITGLIKANIPTRIALQVSSQIDSRTILDTGGAEKLLGAGDMLYLSNEMSKPRRIQSPFISEQEVKKVSSYLTKHYEDEVPSEIDFTETKGDSSIFSATLDDEGDDDLYDEAHRIVTEAGKASTSYLQRKLRVGYARAARLMDMLEERGVIGPADGAKPREVLNRREVDESAGEDEAVFEEEKE